MVETIRLGSVSAHHAKVRLVPRGQTKASRPIMKDPKKLAAVVVMVVLGALGAYFGPEFVADACDCECEE